MKVERFIFGPFQTNTYVVSDEQRVLLVDPACYTPYEQNMLKAYIDDLRLKIEDFRIIATHGHLDHLWGAKWATEQWQTPVLMHEADLPMANAMQQQYDLFGIRSKAQSFPMEPLSLQPSAFSFQIIETPGHTPGSICLYWPEAKTLLSGDTLFQMGYGRTDLPGGHFGQLIRSLEHLFELPSDVRVYPGHGDFTTIGAERR